MPANSDERRYRSGAPPAVANRRTTTNTSRPSGTSAANMRAAQEAMNRGRQAQALSNNERFWSAEPEQARASLAEFLGATGGPPAPGPVPRLGGAGSGGGGGGGGGGMSLAEVQALADQAYAFDPAPYDQMRAAIGTQREQANAYNPDFAAMADEYARRAQGAEAMRAQAVQQRLGDIGSLGQQLAGQQAGALSAASGDLTRAGANLTPFMNQANAIAGDRVGTLGNQGQYLGQLNALSANTLADQLRTSGLVTQGAQATLANNRGSLLNQLGANEADIARQQAEAQAAMNQNRAQFLAQYGAR